MTAPNPSTALAEALVDELSRQGVRYAVISPGSRSAALAIAFDRHPAVETVMVLDERSAAFRALGRAKATGEPTAVVATSGTAGANFLPAVVEADLAGTPLLLLTADRPPDLLGIGSNQTIDQPGLYGGKVRWSVQVPNPDPATDHNRYWRTLAAQAAARANGYGAPPGPVHLNVAFGEPTVPVSDDGRSRADPYPHPIRGRAGGGPWQEPKVASPRGARLDLPTPRRGLVVAGEGGYDGAGLVAAADELGWPVLATALSPVTRRSVVTTYHHLLVDGVPPSLEPDLVVHVGRSGPSDRLSSLTSVAGRVVHIDPLGRWHDPWRRATHMVQADPVETLRLMTVDTEAGWTRRWLEADSGMRAALDRVIAELAAPTGPSLARGLGDLPIARLVAASSMPVRDVDAHTVGLSSVLANRGASGIDGFVSTALGAATGDGATLAFAGDLSLLHDLSGFVGERPRSLVMVVADNDGGGLFDLLPQAVHAPGFDRLFIAPHRLDLVGVGAAIGLEAERIGDVGSLRAEIGARLGRDGIHLLVAPVDRDDDLKARRSLDQAARGQVAGP